MFQVGMAYIDVFDFRWYSVQAELLRAWERWLSQMSFQGNLWQFDLRPANFRSCLSKYRLASQEIRGNKS